MNGSVMPAIWQTANGTILCRCRLSQVVWRKCEGFGPWRWYIVPGWRILPKRWLVERALAWMNQSCRLSKDYEITVASVEALCMIVALRSMIARFWYWYGFLYLHEYYPETKEFVDRKSGRRRLLSCQWQKWSIWVWCESWKTCTDEIYAVRVYCAQIWTSRPNSKYLKS